MPLKKKRKLKPKKVVVTAPKKPKAKKKKSKKEKMLARFRAACARDNWGSLVLHWFVVYAMGQRAVTEALNKEPGISKIVFAAESKSSRGGSPLHPVSSVEMWLKVWVEHGENTGHWRRYHVQIDYEGVKVTRMADPVDEQ